MITPQHTASHSTTASHSSECLAIKFCVVHETVSGGSLGHAACKIYLYSKSSLAAIQFHEVHVIVSEVGNGMVLLKCYAPSNPLFWQ